MKCKSCNLENDKNATVCERCNHEFNRFNSSGSIKSSSCVQSTKKCCNANAFQKLLIILYLFFVSVFSVFKMPMTDYSIRFRKSGVMDTINTGSGFLPIWGYNDAINDGITINYKLYFTYLGISLVAFGFLFTFVSLFKKQEI